MVKALNLALRFFLELFTLIVLGYWGFKIGDGPLTKGLLMIGMPVIIAVIWGLFGSPKAPVQLPKRQHFLFDMIILFLLPAFALYISGNPVFACIYGIISIINTIFIYFLK
ncbi:YrdB family protein [Scopulibacillus cellulosilyticus]|uniref:YrdB family protein n=1 Tax=Scopulibacillus cellulosilyticus TaxID=2665665 RepID=A0ABW2Q0L2_9BACL